MSDNDEDLARGARVELALGAAEQGNVPRTLGLLAGMSGADRAQYGKVVLAVLEQAAPDRMAAVTEAYRAGAL